MKYTIIEVTDWVEDDALMAGDASHEGDRAVQSLLEEERVRKIDHGKADGLPFTCEAESEEEAIDKYNEQICDGDYLKAEAVEFGDAEDCECNGNGGPTRWQDWVAHLLQVAYDIAQEKRDLTFEEYVEYEKDGGGMLAHEIANNMTEDDAAWICARIAEIPNRHKND